MRDHPALSASSSPAPVVTLFVFDDELLRVPTLGPNRIAFLLESREDLRASLRTLGAKP